MRLSRLSFQFGLAACLTLFCLCAASCASQGSLRLQNGSAEVRVESALGSGWQASDTVLQLSPEGESLLVTLSARSREGVQAALFTLRFDEGFEVREAEQLCPRGALSLIAGSAPGALGFGVIMPKGQRLEAGPLLRFRLVPGAARLVVAVPAGERGRVSNLSAAPNGSDLLLSWGYWNAGDYDQNSEANISDLTPLASRLYQSTTDGELDAYDMVLDGDGNGEVNPSDITPLGVNFLRRVSAYRIYRADSEDLDSAASVLLGEASFDTSNLLPQTQRSFSFNIPAADIAADAWYYVKCYDGSDSTEGAASNLVQAPGGGSAPVWTLTTGITAATPGDGQVTVSWGEASDADAPPVQYVIYYNAGAAVDFDTALTMLVDAPALSANVGGLTNGSLYAFAVRARDSALPPHEDNNTVQLTATPVPDLLYNAVPSGMTEVDPEFGLNPCLLLMPAVPEVSQAGAPIVAYSRTDAAGSFQTLTLAYYRGSSWQNTAILDTRNFSHPRLLWQNDEFVLIAFDTDASLLVDFRLNPQLEILSENTVVDALGAALTQIDVDVDPQSGDIGVASAYGTAVMFCDYTGSYPWTSAPVYSGDSIGGLTFRYDPAGADPWLLYTHGTIDTTEGLLLDFDLDEARRSGGNWNSTTLTEPPGSPLLADLQFKSDGTPQLALTVGEDFSAPIPGNPFTATLKFHVYGGEYAGAWNFTQLYQSQFSIGITGGFPPTLFDLTLDFAAEADWTREDELIYTRMQGVITVDAVTFIPEEGALAAEMVYLRDSGGGFNPLLGYFTGAPGLSFSWQELGAVHACAYIKTAEEIDASSLLSGNFEAANAMVYWQAP